MQQVEVVLKSPNEKIYLQAVLPLSQQESDEEIAIQLINQTDEILRNGIVKRELKYPDVRFEQIADLWMNFDCNFHRDSITIKDGKKKIGDVFELESHEIADLLLIIK